MTMVAGGEGAAMVSPVGEMVQGQMVQGVVVKNEMADTTSLHGANSMMMGKVKSIPSADGPLPQVRPVMVYYFVDLVPRGDLGPHHGCWSCRSPT